MKRFGFAVLLALVSAAPAAAQQPAQPAAQQAPGILVVSAQKCRFTALENFKRLMREDAAPVLNDLVKQGRLISWGVLEHAWGDEWNMVIYYSARDLNTFQAAMTDYFGQLMKKDPQLMQKFESYCSEHKDNVYSIAMTNNTTMPR